MAVAVAVEAHPGGYHPGGCCPSGYHPADYPIPMMTATAPAKPTAKPMATAKPPDWTGRPSPTFSLRPTRMRTSVYFVRLLQGRRVCRLAPQGVAGAACSSVGDLTCQLCVERFALTLEHTHTHARARAHTHTHTDTDTHVARDCICEKAKAHDKRGSCGREWLRARASVTLY